MKKFMAIVVTGISLYQVPVALAGPVNMTGDVSIKYARTNGEAAAMIYTSSFMGEADFGAGWSGYGRLGAQHLTKSGFGDFNTDPGGYDPDKKSVIAFDQFGLLYKVDNLSNKLGRQNVGVGTTALLYSRPASNIGKNAFVDGLTVTGTIGVMDVSALIAQEDNVDDLDNKVYAIRTGYSPRENLNWGLTLGRYQGPFTESTNHLAVYGTYKLGKNSLTAEFSKSSSSVDNKAYAATWNYDFDDKTTSYITGFRAESNGAMGQQSDFDYGNHGFHYGITHNISNADSLEVVYKAQKTISDRQNNNKLEVTFTHGF